MHLFVFVLSAFPQTSTEYMICGIISCCILFFFSLHRHLVEHLNAEIALQTISNVNMALDWIRSTFLYIRALKNPTHYGQSSPTQTYLFSVLSITHWPCVTDFSLVFAFIPFQESPLIWTDVGLKQNCKVCHNCSVWFLKIMHYAVDLTRPRFQG